MWLKEHGRKKENEHHDLACRSLGKTPDWLHSTRSQRARESIDEDHTDQSPGSTELGREARGVHLEGQIKASSTKISFGLDTGNFPNASLHSS